jgi:toxin HigB-1
MIKSFKSRALRDYWLRGIAKGIKPEWRDRIHDLLSVLDAADVPEDTALPTFGFHPLKGDRKGNNWRITFQWKDGHAVKVNMEDYHGR